MTIKKLAPRDEAGQRLTDANAILEEALKIKWRDRSGTIRLAITRALEQIALASAQMNGAEVDPVKGDLSDLEYRNLEEGGKLADKRRPGLLMRNRKRGGKRWFFRFAHPDHGKQVELAIGPYPNVSLADVRDIWRNLRAQRDLGKMPTRDPDDNEADKGRDPLSMPLNEVWLRWVAEYGKPVKRPSSLREDVRMWEKHITPNYGQRPVRDFNGDTVRVVLNVLVKRDARREAEKLKALISTVFNVACGRTRKIDMLEETWLPADLPNPTLGVSLAKRTPKFHDPSPKELRGYVSGLEALGIAGTVLRIQIETFARISEVTGMTWDEIDLDEGVWTLPADRAKNGLKHKVMLSTQSVDRLRELSEEGDTTFVFPQRNNTEKAMDDHTPMKAIAKNREALGVHEDFTSHSTRRAGLAWLSSNGASKETRNRVSNHKEPSSDMDGHYTSAAVHDRQARKWTQKWCRYLASLEADNVVQIGEVRK